MITNCYIKSRYDYGIGKCAVVIVDDVAPNQEQPILHQSAWKVPAQWEYKWMPVTADQQNCEILAAVYAIRWCMENGKQLVNIYTNTVTCTKWYCRFEFPDSRSVMGRAYTDAVSAFIEKADAEYGKSVPNRIYAEDIRKDDPNPWNMLVNSLADNVR